MTQEEKEEIFRQGIRYALNHLWRSVDDEIPNEFEPVFVRIETPFGISYDVDMIVLGIWKDNFNVTHWMPIPRNINKTSETKP